MGGDQNMVYLIMKVNEAKLTYMLKEMKLIPHLLRSEGARSLSKYIESIKEFRAPETKQKLKSFLGLVI